jgi:predicted PurR-regulated permease PerM
MDEKYFQYLKPISALAVVAFMGWYFMDIVAFILAAIFLSMIGSPVVKRLDRIKFGKKNMPHALSAATTLLSIIIGVGLFLILIVPLIVSQANVIASIDVKSMSEYFQNSMKGFYEFLVQYNVVDPQSSFVQYIQEQLVDVVDLAKFTNFFANLVSGTGSVLMGVFIIVFLTYYFLLENDLAKRSLLMLVPDKQMANVEQVLHDSKFLLVRYFHGILIEVGIMMTLEATGLLIFGIPNAILIGFIGGLMNIIPYLGPLIGGLIGIILAGLSVMGIGDYESLWYTVIVVAAVFGGANIVDNFVLQPQIYSKSVKAHPVEIFLAIIVGGKISGIAGMILAIPTYTVLKVVIRQFRQRMKLNDFLSNKKGKNPNK